MNKNHIKTPFYNLSLDYNQGKLLLQMQLLCNSHSSSQFPATELILKEYLPEIVNCECINRQNIPFSEKLKNTHLGHLYEHILMEYLADLKFANEGARVELCGKTRWNWKSEKYGLYHIEIDLPKEDLSYLEIALLRTDKIMDMILSGHMGENAINAMSKNSSYELHFS